MPVAAPPITAAEIELVEKCEFCGKDFDAATGITTGYGYQQNPDDKLYYKICYLCCAKSAVQDMVAHGDTFLYLTKVDNKYKITNWPGNLIFFPYAIKLGTHNVASTRTDAWFIGPDNKVWHGVQLGNNGDIIRCKRTKHPLPRYTTSVQWVSYTRAREGYDESRRRYAETQRRVREIQERRQAVAAGSN